MVDHNPGGTSIFYLQGKEIPEFLENFEEMFLQEHLKEMFPQ